MMPPNGVVTMGGMHILRRRPVAIVYWLLAFVVSVLGGVGGAMIGRDAAPQFTDKGAGAPATSGGQLLLGVLGFLLGFAVVLALFSGVWLLAWIRERRAVGAPVEDEELAEDTDMDDLLTDEDGRRVGDDG